MDWTDLLNELFQWTFMLFGMILLARVFVRQIKQNEDLTSQLVAMKNPWAAQMFQGMKDAQVEQTRAADPERIFAQEPLI